MVKLPPVFLSTIAASVSMPTVKARALPQVENFHSTFGPLTSAARAAPDVAANAARIAAAAIRCAGFRMGSTSLGRESAEEIGSPLYFDRRYCGRTAGSPAAEFAADGACHRLTLTQRPTTDNRWPPCNLK